MARIPINLSIFILALTVPILATTSDSSPVVTPDSSSWSRGQEINFTCAVEGAETFGWKSSEYIGSGNDALSFSVSHQIGDIRTNGRIDGTYAVLVSKEGSRLESILHVITQFHGTISCVITDPPELTTNVTISIIDVDSSEDQLDRVITTEKPPDSTAITEPDPSPNLPTAGNSSALSTYTTSNFIIIFLLLLCVIEGILGGR